MKPTVIWSFIATLALGHAYNHYNYEAMARRAMTTTAAPSTTQTPDSWQCVTANLTQFFDVPKPTGSLLAAMNSFGDSLIAPCMKTASGPQRLGCTVSGPSAWCPFSNKATAAVSAAYSSYARSAAVWWKAKSSGVADARRDCPVTWEKFGSADQSWLNLTVAHAECYLKVSPIVSNGVVSTTTSKTAAPKSTTSLTSKATTTATKAKTS